MATHLEDARAKLTEATKGISALCVRRPVLTIVFNLLIVLAGLAAFTGVEIRELPDIDRPVITVRATYDGATPETVDTQVTRVLEAAASRVPGVKEISSSSRSGSSRIVVEFDDFSRSQRRCERPPRRRRKRRAAASGGGRRRFDRQGRRQFRRDHPPRRHRQGHADPGPDEARRGQCGRPPSRGRWRRRRHGLRRSRAARPGVDQPERARRARAHSVGSRDGVEDRRAR